MLDSTTRDAILEVRAEAERQGITATFSLHREQSHLMRLGNSSVSLNTSEDLTRLDVEVTDGRRQGSQTLLGRIDGSAVVREALETARGKAAMAMPKDYDPIPGAVESEVRESDQHDPALAEMDPAVKADGYRRIMDALGHDFNYSGAWSSGAMEQFLVTSRDEREAWHRGTDQHMTLVLKHPRARWELRGTESGWRADDVRPERVIEELRGLLPVYRDHPGTGVEPGHYTVILGAEALADIAGMAAWSGLSGRSWEEKQGWTSRAAIGDRILGENVTLVDDPTDGNTFRFGFDLSGRRRAPYALVESGVLAGLMYDSSTAARYGREPTGHDLSSPSLTMAPGDGPADPLEAIDPAERALWIPALHYTHIPNRSEGLFTGSSRFNAVIVEGGKIAGPIFSTRITDTFANVLGNIAVLARARVSVNQSNTYGRRSPIAMSVPEYAVVRGVRITDAAEAF